ncbi:hypothetical protein BC827DRAFT_1196723 [Russula dissimulans]|nr:hypothetical protein BC827DRAFT_1196723 [Russula dissimulans]
MEKHISTQISHSSHFTCRCGRVILSNTALEVLILAFSVIFLSARHGRLHHH